MWYWGTGVAGWMWLVGMLMMLVFWSGVAALVLYLVRGLAGRGQTQSDAAMGTLRRRLAAGEITQDEFERTRQLIQT